MMTLGGQIPPRMREELCGAIMAIAPERSTSLAADSAGVVNDTQRALHAQSKQKCAHTPADRTRTYGQYCGCCENKGEEQCITSRMNQSPRHAAAYTARHDNRVGLESYRTKRTQQQRKGGITTTPQKDSWHRLAESCSLSTNTSSPESESSCS